MKTRIRAIRKDHLKMTQQDFADKLGLSQNFIWQIEKGERTPSDRTIADICREFGVDRVWLETGVGEPFRPRSREDEIATALAQAMSCNETAKHRIIRAMAQLPDELFPYVERILDELAANIQQDK